MSKEFWKNWKNKSKLEITAINSIKKAKNLLLKNIPKKQITSIYIKGSFVRRELTKTSDVDIVPIVKDSRYLKKILKLQKEYSKEIAPSELLPHSIREFKENKRFLMAEGPKAHPNLFIKRLKYYNLIYGKPLDVGKFSVRSDEQRFSGLIKAFKELFIPLYNQKKLDFPQIVKQVFWLVDMEERIKGREPPHSWKKLAKSIKNKNHIIHDALKFRLNPTKDKKERDKFIRKLNKYITNLSKL